MEQAKKRKKGKPILVVVLLLLAAAMVVAVLYFYPVWRCAGILQEKATGSCLTYELQVELDKAELEPQQAKMLEILESLTGCGQDSMYQLTIRGSVWGNKIHALVYPKGSAAPLMEFYMSDDADVINEAVLYNTIRENLTKQYGLLNYLMPVQENDVYMTLEQVEQMFDVGLQGIRDFALPMGREPAQGKGLTIGKCFIMLAAMSKGSTDTGRQFSLMAEWAKVTVEVAEGGGRQVTEDGNVQAAENGQEAVGGQAAEGGNAQAAENKSGQAVTVTLSVGDPKEAFAQAEKLLSRLGVQVPGEQQLRMLKHLDLTLQLGEGEEIVMPTEFISQDTVELISKIREFVQKLLPQQGSPDAVNF